MFFHQLPRYQQALFEATFASLAEHDAEIAAEEEAIAPDLEAAIAEAKQFRKKFARGDRRRQNRRF